MEDYFVISIVLLQIAVFLLQSYRIVRNNPRVFVSEKVFLKTPFYGLRKAIIIEACTPFILNTMLVFTIYIVGLLFLKSPIGAKTKIFFDFVLQYWLYIIGVASLILNVYVWYAFERTSNKNQIHNYEK